ncbi:MAG: hypothetical protein LH702_19140 [Phormidesmis sp. CAN_BIN44]|nr:hypothetical protein [Phormidesmis sp. CAN_BIN44]
MQVRATIPAHLHPAFLEIGKQLNTTDPSVINTHILSCYFTGDRSDSPRKSTASAQTADNFEDVADWTDDNEL